MSINTAATGISVRQDCKALETEAGAAIAAEHFVTLLVLCLLTLDVFLRHGYAACRALLRTRLFDPLHQISPTFVALALSAGGGDPLGLGLLAGHTPMVWLRTAFQAGCLLADHAL